MLLRYVRQRVLPPRAVTACIDRGRWRDGLGIRFGHIEYSTPHKEKYHSSMHTPPLPIRSSNPQKTQSTKTLGTECMYTAV